MDEWVLERIREGLEPANRVRTRKGKEPLTVDPTTFTYTTGMSEEWKCCCGEEACTENIAPTPCVTVTALTSEGATTQYSFLLEKPQQ